ncbi:enoyl-CoA hydratase/isomerase family protein [Chloroflexi bacterium TSY]|nr:enoyl-CoA hydratase/isomerase family protein [Chloroflexi bacterium TSY]
MTEIVLIQRDDDIATVVLNRPEKLNALSKALWVGVGEAMRALSADDDIRCIVLRGAGDRAFSPGADIKEFETERSNVAQARAYGTIMHDTMGAIRDCHHPTIAMINGICVGGGLELACMCDLRICGESSRFGVPINRIGVIMAYPEIEALIDLVGRATALEILLEGRVFSAQEAKEKNLVTRVVADDELEKSVYESARRIADGAPHSNRLHKKFARRLLELRPLTAEEFDEGFASASFDDYQEGYRAFVEKRKPAFTGH